MSRWALLVEGDRKKLLKYNPRYLTRPFSLASIELCSVIREVNKSLKIFIRFPYAQKDFAPKHH